MPKGQPPINYADALMFARDIIPLVECHESRSAAANAIVEIMQQRNWAALPAPVEDDEPPVSKKPFLSFSPPETVDVLHDDEQTPAPQAD